MSKEAAGKGGAKGASDKRGPREIPDRCLTRAGVEEGVIGVGVTIEIRRAYHSPATRQSGTEGAAKKNVVLHVPHRGLARAPVVKHIIWCAVVVEVI